MSLKLFCACDEAGSAAIMSALNANAMAVAFRFLSRLVTACSPSNQSTTQPANHPAQIIPQIIQEEEWGEAVAAPSPALSDILDRAAAVPRCRDRQGC